MNYDKFLSLTGLGATGAFIANLFGGWGQSMTTLIIVITLDFISGLLVAISGKSQKTETGLLSSQVSFVGIAKKCMILILVVLGNRIDLALQLNFVKEMIVIAYILNESISIIENADLLGLPVPKKLRDLINNINKKLENEDDKNTKGFGK